MSHAEPWIVVRVLPRAGRFETMRGTGLFLILFAMLGAVGNLRLASTSRSLRAFYSMTLVGAGGHSTRVGNAMMRMHEGTGSTFGSMILANISTNPGIRIENCTQISSTDTPSTVRSRVVSLYCNLVGKFTIDPHASCHGATCTHTGRNSTTDDGLRKGAQKVFEIAPEELFIEVKIEDAEDVKYSFRYDQTSEDIAGNPIEKPADLDDVPWELAECLDLAFVLLRLASFVWAIWASRRRSGPNERCANQTHCNQRFALALFVLVIPRVSAMATTAPPDGDGIGGHRAESAQTPPLRQRPESAQSPPLRPRTPTLLCADDVNSGALDSSGAPLPCSYFEAQPSACASYSIAQTNCPVACGTCPPDPPGVVVSTGADTSHRTLALEMHAMQLNHRRAQQAQAVVLPSLTSALSTSAGRSPVTAPPFLRSPFDTPLPASPTPWLLPRSSPSPPLPSPTPLPPRPPPSLPPPQPPPSPTPSMPVLTPSFYPRESFYHLPTPPGSSAPAVSLPAPMSLPPILLPPTVWMPSPPPPLSLLMPPPPLPCTVLPCTKASDIPGLNSVQLVPSHHRRELQTAVSTTTGLLSAFANTAVGRIVLAPGTYNLTAELSITRSVVLEAAVAGSVVLDAQASYSSPRRVLHINPGTTGVVELIGLNITRGYISNVRSYRRDL